MCILVQLVLSQLWFWIVLSFDRCISALIHRLRTGWYNLATGCYSRGWYQWEFGILNQTDIRFSAYFSNSSSVQMGLLSKAECVSMCVLNSMLARWNRDGTENWVFGSRITGSAILAGSGHESVCQTWCLTRFWVLTCVFVVTLFLQSNSISANWCFGSVPITALLVYLFQFVPVIFTYLRADCPCDVMT